MTLHVPYVLFLTNSGHAGYTPLQLQSCIVLLGLDKEEEMHLLNGH
jgi:hypothetical protein